MFIQLNENNEIIASADFKFVEDAIETDKKVIRNYDGKLVFEGEETDNTSHKKEIEILKLKQNCSEEIYKLYPIYKQIDILGRIGGYTNKDFEEMKIFIEEKINEYKEKKYN